QVRVVVHRSIRDTAFNRIGTQTKEWVKRVILVQPTEQPPNQFLALSRREFEDFRFEFLNAHDKSSCSGLLKSNRPIPVRVLIPRPRAAHVG
ncbi:MAG: hypothetical protein AVDCRST_MAG89-3498, partial [uncultured Gemmatimonadetes bacterium]